MNPKRIEPNDDSDELDAEEIEDAAEEPLAASIAPEEDAKTENLTEWDQPATASGSATPKTPLDDETSIAEELTEEGLDEADREQRIASADPDFEP